jgi:hypothetical protein
MSNTFGRGFESGILLIDGDCALFFNIVREKFSNKERTSIQPINLPEVNARTVTDLGRKLDIMRIIAFF